MGLLGRGIEVYRSPHGPQRIVAGVGQRALDISGGQGAAECVLIRPFGHDSAGQFGDEPAALRIRTRANGGGGAAAFELDCEQGARTYWDYSGTLQLQNASLLQCGDAFGVRGEPLTQAQINAWVEYHGAPVCADATGSFMHMIAPDIPGPALHLCSPALQSERNQKLLVGTQLLTRDPHTWAKTIEMRAIGSIEHESWHRPGRIARAARDAAGTVGRVLICTDGNYAAACPIFDDGATWRRVYDNHILGSVADLVTALTVNSITEYPKWRYSGADAIVSGWPKWGYGNDAVPVEGGAAPTFGVASPYANHAKDGAVRFNNGDLFNDPAAFDTTTEDIGLRLIFKTPASGTSWLFGTFDGVSGWVLTASPTALTMNTNDGTGFVALSSGTLTASTWYRAWLFWHRATNTCAIYIEGTLSGTPGALSTGSMHSILGLYLGGGCGGNANCEIALAEMWARNTWFDSHLQTALVAAQDALLD